MDLMPVGADWHVVSAVRFGSGALHWVPDSAVICCQETSARAAVVLVTSMYLGLVVVLEVLPVHGLLMDPVQVVLPVAPMALVPNPVVLPDFPGVCLARAC